MQRLTTTIRRKPFAEILSSKKKIEYREIKEYWENRLSKYKPPFLLRLINGMSKQAPELTVQVAKVPRNNREVMYELHLGKIVESKNCRGLDKP
jgi:hypothetical protein